MSPAATVYLVRHGEVHNPDHVVYADLPGFGLSERGRRQAEEASIFLAPRDIGAVFSSPLQRATETAAALARPHGLAVETVPALTEWLLAQRWKGLPWDELDEHHPGDLQAYLDHPLDLAFSPESLEALASRMVDAIQDVTERSRASGIVVVSHQDPIQAARLALTHRTLATLNADKPEHAEVFELRVGTPWVEIGRWAPAEQEAFPPPGEG